MDIEVFRAENPPQMQRYDEALEVGMLRGNMGSLVVMKLCPGLEMAEHTHQQEHVGAVLAGEFSSTDGDKETVLRAGDLYRVPPNVAHGVSCTTYALVVQARADFLIQTRST